MIDTAHPTTRHPFLRRIESVALFKLSDEERAALNALPMQMVQIEPNQDIVREGIVRPGASRSSAGSPAPTNRPAPASGRL
ncbi:hypothetical protein ACRBEV_28935 [Methylobacterium phyllosphaerae]